MYLYHLSFTPLSNKLIIFRGCHNGITANFLVLVSSPSKPYLWWLCRRSLWQSVCSSMLDISSTHGERFESSSLVSIFRISVFNFGWSFQWMRSVPCVLFHCFRSGTKGGRFWLFDIGSKGRPRWEGEADFRNGRNSIADSTLGTLSRVILPCVSSASSLWKCSKKNQ